MSEDVDYNGGNKKNGSIVRRVAEAAGTAFGPNGWLLQFIQLPATVIIAGMCVYIVLILGPEFYNNQIEQADINRKLFQEETGINRKLFQEEIRETRAQFRDEIKATREQHEEIRRWEEEREESRRKWDDLRWQATNELIRDNHRVTMEGQRLALEGQKISEGRWQVAQKLLDTLMEQMAVQQKLTKFQSDAMRLLIKQVDMLKLELKKRGALVDPPQAIPPTAESGAVGSGVGMARIPSMPYVKR